MLSFPAANKTPGVTYNEVYKHTLVYNNNSIKLTTFKHHQSNQLRSLQNSNIITKLQHTNIIILEYEEDLNH